MSEDPTAGKQTFFQQQVQRFFTSIFKPIVFLALACAGFVFSFILIEALNPQWYWLVGATFFWGAIAIFACSQVEWPNWWEDHRDVSAVSGALLAVCAGGLYLVWGVTQFSDKASLESSRDVTLLASLAYLAVGFLVGFVFGIPRVIQPDGKDAAQASDKLKYDQRVNTNLEQILTGLQKSL